MCWHGKQQREEDAQCLHREGGTRTGDCRFAGEARGAGGKARRLPPEIEDAIVARIKQRDELDALREENRQLRKRLALYEPPAQDEPPADAAGVPVEDSPAEPARTREEQEFFDSFRIYVVGGTEKWQKKAAEVFPTMHFLGSEKNFDRSALAQADYVIINTNAVSHACTEKAKNAAPKSAAIIMTSNNNLPLLRQKLLETIQ